MFKNDKFDDLFIQLITCLGLPGSAVVKLERQPQMQMQLCVCKLILLTGASVAIPFVTNIFDICLDGSERLTRKDTGEVDILGKLFVSRWHLKATDKLIASALGTKCHNFQIFQTQPIQQRHRLS